MRNPRFGAEISAACFKLQVRTPGGSNRIDLTAGNRFPAGRSILQVLYLTLVAVAENVHELRYAVDLLLDAAFYVGESPWL